MKAYIVAGLCFGDEGKGSMIDYLVRRHKARLVIRYNGGSQAAHNVVTDTGEHHTFSQFGSGTLAGAGTHLSEYMLVEPFALMKEAEVLMVKGFSVYSKISISDRCVVITPFHWKANQIREIFRGKNRHGSVGRGVGEARADEISGLALRIGDLDRRSICLEKLEAIKQRKLAELLSIRENCHTEPTIVNLSLSRLYDEIKNENIIELFARYQLFCAAFRPQHFLLDRYATVVFEGAQGVLLDESIGFPPYNTWTDTTFKNALSICNQLGAYSIEKIGVTRSYFTRHGPGPFPTEIDKNNKLAPVYLNMEEHNKPNLFMGDFRVGYFDVPLFSYAVSRSQPDVIAVTHLDREKEKIGVGYTPPIDMVQPSDLDLTKVLSQAQPEYFIAKDFDLLRWIERIAPVRYRSYGPRPSDKWEKLIKTSVKSAEIS
jgi:adenylosuccinate synthase